MSENKRIICICSGGQTGIDRAALDASMELGLLTGGWCPKGRRAEDGIISDKYDLIETISFDYWERTKLNVIDSSATMIFLPENKKKCRGSFLTISYAKKYTKPYFILNMDTFEYEIVNKWLLKIKPNILNIAGPRESNYPGIYNEGKEIIRNILKNFISS